MSTVSVTNINDGDAVTAASVNSQINTIVNDYNGNIGTTNLAASAVTDAKIAANNLLTTKFSNPYKFSVYLNAAQNTSTSFGKILLDTKEYDTGTNFDAVTNHRFTAPVAGFYQVNGSLNVAMSGTSGMQLALYKNGVLFKTLGAINGTLSNTYANDVSSGVLVQLAANDYLELYQICIGVTAITTGAAYTWFSGFLVSSI